MTGVVGRLKVGSIIQYVHSTVLAACVMCSSLALSNAGVEMVDLPVACAVVCFICMQFKLCSIQVYYYNSQSVESTTSLIRAFQKSIVLTELVFLIYLVNCMVFIEIFSCFITPPFLGW